MADWRATWGAPRAQELLGRAYAYLAQSRIFMSHDADDRPPAPHLGDEEALLQAARAAHRQAVALARQRLPPSLHFGAASLDHHVDKGAAQQPQGGVEEDAGAAGAALGGRVKAGTWGQDDYSHDQGKDGCEHAYYHEA